MPANAGIPLAGIDLLDLLTDVRLEREDRYWNDVAACTTAAGALNFGGGAEDSGGRAADASRCRDTEIGRKIRGQ